MTEQFLIIATALVIALIIVVAILQLVKKLELKYFRNKLKMLEIKRNEVASTPVLLELSKVEPIIKNDVIEEKYNYWQDKFTEIKEKRLSIVDDMLLDLDIYIDKRDYKNCGSRIAKIELEIYKVRQAANNLLEDIKDITLSEEKYRAIIIKLKTRYREINKKFNDDKDLYYDMADFVALQIENIEIKFLDFEKYMEKNDYNEVVHIVKALDNMINHMEIVVLELPDILLMARHILPNRIKEVKSIYNDMLGLGYILDYLNLDYNIEESNKNINIILNNVKVLNLENAMFELTTMLSYYDSLFVDFEKEKLSKKVYDDNLISFKKRLNRVNTQVNSVFDNLDNIKNMYNLTDVEVNNIDEARKLLVVINDDYNKIVLKEENKVNAYSLLYDELDNVSSRLNDLEDSFKITLKSLGNMYDDEDRAREQLKEIGLFLKQAEDKIYSYKLPVIIDVYFIQLQEAREAVGEIVKELEKKPIEINVLNTRVDTARDLVLKLFNTTNEMVKTAKMVEVSIVYGNRYRSSYKDIDRGLRNSEREFFKGNYQKALDIAIKSISILDKDIYQKLLSLYDK